MIHGKVKERPEHQYADAIIGHHLFSNALLDRKHITKIIRLAIETERRECAEAVCYGCRNGLRTEVIQGRDFHFEPGQMAGFLCAAMPILARTRLEAINEGDQP